MSNKQIHRNNVRSGVSLHGSNYRGVVVMKTSGDGISRKLRNPPNQEGSAHYKFAMHIWSILMLVQI